ncbi:hypothetical protein IFR05_005593 [Cadophora sp. M221]|nr:hypothetical protein IFR05_005593 [Cadophora sp. M221]
MRYMKPIFRDEVYSPVKDIITYKNVVFTTGFGPNRTPYMGNLTSERETLWDDLYNNFGTSIIPTSEAAKLLNKTVPIPDGKGEYDGKYVVMLGVFHQLHCVNLLRKSLYQEPPNSTSPRFSNSTTDPLSLLHLEHCVDALRQAVMCSVDTTPHPWVWSEGEDGEVGQVKEVASIAHTCRDFDSVREWARPRAPKFWNKFINVPDPLKMDLA